MTAGMKDKERKRLTLAVIFVFGGSAYGAESIVDEDARLRALRQHHVC